MQLDAAKLNKAEVLHQPDGDSSDREGASQPGNFDIHNPQKLRAFLLTGRKEDDLTKILLKQFCSVTFGRGTTAQTDGHALLKLFGSQEETVDNLLALLRFAGITVNRFYLADPVQAKEYLCTSKTLHELANIGLRDFLRTNFAVGTPAQKGGRSILTNFGSGKTTEQNMLKLLRWAGIERADLDMTDPEKIKRLLLTTKSEADLQAIDPDTFKATVFAEGTPLHQTGNTLLANFGSRLLTRDNMLGLLRFAGIERMELDINNPTSLKNFLLTGLSEEQLSRVTLMGFIDIDFGTKGAFVRSGRTLLRNFGINKSNTDNLLALLSFAGIKRAEFEIADPDVNQWVTERFLLGDFDIATTDFTPLKSTIPSQLSSQGKRQKVPLYNLAAAAEVLGQQGFKSERREKLLRELRLKKKILGSRLGLDAIAVQPLVNDAYRDTEDSPDLAAIARQLRAYPHYNDRRFDRTLDRDPATNKIQMSWSDDVYLSIYTDESKQRWATRELLPHLGVLAELLDNSSNHITTITTVEDYEQLEFTLLNVAEVIDHLDPRASDLQPLPEPGLYQNTPGLLFATPDYTQYALGISEKEWLVVKQLIPTVRLGKQYDRLYNYAQAERIHARLFTIPEVAADTGIYVDQTGAQFSTAQQLSEIYGVSDESIRARKDRIATLPGRGRIKQSQQLFDTLLYNVKEAQAVLEDDGLLDRLKKETQRQLRNSLETTVTDIKAGETIEAQHIRQILNVIGASRCADILYKFHPQFKDISPEYVKGVIAHYLGDFLLVKGKFNPRDVEVARDYLSDITVQEGIYESIKEDCLKHFYEQRRRDKTVTGHDIIYAYLGKIVNDLHECNLDAPQKKQLDDIVQKVIDFYHQALDDFDKPEAFVDTLSTDREFPDINQRINMKELADKKRLLIADEMGLGKSASTIMAKEQFKKQAQERARREGKEFAGHCALVVAPSNVLDTWEQYLSEESRGGYFKSGEAPRVLRVESVEDIAAAWSEGASAGDARKIAAYDYVLVSHERINDRHTELLAQIPYDMLVVDEVHKFKNIAGVRSGNLVRLAERIKDEHQHLALLSGTPIPNKIQDVAVILKLLYPDTFGATEDGELVRDIIQGKIIDLRSLLVPRMQMKSLEDGVEMPPLTEEVAMVKLSKLEQDIYLALLEDDELTAAEKMTILRQFCLNPKLVDATPGLESSKLNAAGNDLREFFQYKDKHVLFVNDYVEDVIRGEDAIIEELGLPASVEVLTIHGQNRGERSAIVDRFNTSSGKVLLMVSGKTADVGVDLSVGQGVSFLNLPWTVADWKQQLRRVCRPGQREAVTSKVYVTEGTIEQGIYEYILQKYHAMEKVLRGIPPTDREKELLTKEEDSPDPNLAVNDELARYYFSSWDRLMRMFGYVKEIGEVSFKEFLTQYGDQYAESYADLGSRSYQANANRVTGTIINQMAAEQGKSPAQTRVIDLASGPEMLKQHIGAEWQDRVFSIDINQQHFAQSAAESDGKSKKRAVGSLLALPFADGSFDFANLSLAFQYLNFAPSKGKYERLQALTEINRVLSVGGRAVINLIYSLELKDFERFTDLAGDLGFRVVEEYSGAVKAGNQYQSHVITLEKMTSLDPELTIEARSEQLGKDKREALKFKKTGDKVKDSRRVITGFALGEKKLSVDFNPADQAVYEEEQTFLAEAERLKQAHGSIPKIPAEVIREHGFVRIRSGKKYLLFKKLTKGPGVVIVK